jgi:hypothetical protein
LDFSSTATWPRTAPIPCARAATRCGAFPSMAITSRPPVRTALVCSQAPRTPSRSSGLSRAKARRNAGDPRATRSKRRPRPSARGESGGLDHYWLAADGDVSSVSRGIKTPLGGVPSQSKRGGSTQAECRKSISPPQKSGPEKSTSRTVQVRPLIRSAARSAIAMTGAWVSQAGMTGITEASVT